MEVAVGAALEDETDRRRTGQGKTGMESLEVQTRARLLVRFRMDCWVEAEAEEGTCLGN